MHNLCFTCQNQIQHYQCQNKTMHQTHNKNDMNLAKHDSRNNQNDQTARINATIHLKEIEKSQRRW